MSLNNIKDFLGQTIKIGDHAVLLDNDTDTPGDTIKVLDIEIGDYSDPEVYVELAFEKKTSVDPMRMYVSPDRLILTKTKVVM